MHTRTKTLFQSNLSRQFSVFVVLFLAASSVTPFMMAQTESVIYNFCSLSNCADGHGPSGVLVKDASGKPITGAQVDLGLFMPQMGTMPPMSSKGALTEVGNGIYQGSIEVLMAWTWQTTVTVHKNGAVVGIAQTTITSR